MGWTNPNWLLGSEINKPLRVRSDNILGKVISLILGVPQIHTNREFVHVSTLPLEEQPANYFQGRQKLPYEGKINLGDTVAGGTLKVVAPTGIPKIKQGGQDTLNFSILLEETEVRIGGLNLYATFAENVTIGNLVVYEQLGVYFLDLNIRSDMAVGTYEIEIYVKGQVEFIGIVTFQVEELIVEDPDKVNPLDLAIEFGGFALFIALAFAIIGLMFRINSKN